MTVVINNDDYDGKIRSLLVDTDTYKRPATDLTLAQERRKKALLLLLTRSEAIHECLYH